MERQRLIEMIDAIVNERPESPALVLQMLDAHAKSLGHGVLHDITVSLTNPIHVFRSLMDESYETANSPNVRAYGPAFALYLFMFLVYSDDTARKAMQRDIGEEKAHFLDYCYELGELAVTSSYVRGNCAHIIRFIRAALKANWDLGLQLIDVDTIDSIMKLGPSGT